MNCQRKLLKPGVKASVVVGTAEVVAAVRAHQLALMACRAGENTWGRSGNGGQCGRLLRGFRPGEQTTPLCEIRRKIAIKRAVCWGAWAGD